MMNKTKLLIPQPLLLASRRRGWGMRRFEYVAV
jgi:hypothetical protein